MNRSKMKDGHRLLQAKTVDITGYIVDIIVVKINEHRSIHWLKPCIGK